MKKIIVFIFIFVAISFANAQDASNTKVITSTQNASEDDESQWLQN